MPIAAHINEKLGLRVHDIFGAIAPSEFADIANFYCANPHWNRADLLSLVRDDIDLSNFSPEHLAGLRALYRELHEHGDFILLRRSAWVCSHVSGWRLLEEFLKDRHALDGQGTEVCLVATLPEASCIFDQNEIEAVTSWRDFRELVCVGAGPNEPTMTARAREARG